MNKTDGSIIETRSLSEQVYQYLCSQIIEGEIYYGETVNIKLIAKHLNVSAMPVREAIKRLEIEGMVLVKPRSTCIVRKPTRKTILDALELRELLEIHCVESVYETVEASKLEPLNKIIARMREILEWSDAAKAVKEYIKCDRLFHTEICRLVGNELLSKFHREMSLQLNMNFMYGISVPPNYHQTFKDHAEIVDAIARHSHDAVTIMKKHLLKARKNTVDGRAFSALENDSDEPQILENPVLALQSIR